jgi:hypothetical protein
MTEILREESKNINLDNDFYRIWNWIILCLIWHFHFQFVQNMVGLEHKYKRNLNSANLYEILSLLEKYNFRCLTPFDEKFFTTRLHIYI